MHIAAGRPAKMEAEEQGRRDQDGDKRCFPPEPCGHDEQPGSMCLPRSLMERAAGCPQPAHRYLNH